MEWYRRTGLLTRNNNYEQNFFLFFGTISSIHIMGFARQYAGTVFVYSMKDDFNGLRLEYKR